MMLTYAVEHRLYPLLNELLGYNDDTSDEVYTVNNDVYFLFLKEAFSHDDVELLSYIFCNIPIENEMTVVQATQLREVWLKTIEIDNKYDIVDACSESVEVDDSDSGSESGQTDADNDKDAKDTFCLIDYIIVAIYGVIYADDDVDTHVLKDIRRIKTRTGIDLTETFSLTE
jgi:hypothetical protein